MARKSSHIDLLLLAFLAAWLQLLALNSCQGQGLVECIELERQALLAFRAGLVDRSHRLSSWSGGDCCAWYGVVCDNRTGHVVRLNLRNHDQGLNLGLFEQARKQVSLGGKINQSLLALSHLTYLDLSGNDFRGTCVPSFIGSFSALRYLNLSSARFGGIIPQSLGNLSNLHSLDLSNNDNRLDKAEWLAQLTSLELLDISYSIILDAPKLFEALNKLPFIAEIRLSFCGGMNNIPSSLPHLNFTSLRILDLSLNYINTTTPSWVFNLTSLEHLDVSSNRFYDVVPASIDQMTSLVSLDLSYNAYDLGDHVLEALGSLCKLHTLGLSGLSFPTKLSSSGFPISGCMRTSLEVLKLSGILHDGLAPDWVGNLRNLLYLDISNNHLNSSIFGWLFNLNNLQHLDLRRNLLDGPIPFAFRNMSSLVSLDLSSNPSLQGPVPHTLRNLCQLQMLDLSHCNISDRFEEFDAIFSKCIRRNLQWLSLSTNSVAGFIPHSIGDLERLEFLDLSSNLLHGFVPPTIGKLGELASLIISNNSLNGTLSEDHFTNLTKLRALDISANQMAMKVSPNWTPPFQLEWINMSACYVGSQFPAWIKSQYILSVLELSMTGISGHLPSWVWNSLTNLIFLSLRHNQITGKLPENFKLENCLVLDLTNNSFSGSIPQNIGHSFPQLHFLSLSSNNISGVIPSSFCKLLSMGHLILSRNKLSGEIPNCWQNYSLIQVVDLSNNNLSGKIPDSVCSSPLLTSLHLSRNHLHGVIPASFIGCKSMVVLDLGHNNINGSIPSWLGESMPHLRILSLRSNALESELPATLSQLDALQVLDLSNNCLTGIIPRSFGNFTSLKNMTNRSGGFPDSSDGYYTESIILNIKNGEFLIDRLLSLEMACDLSNNRLSGKIPEQLANLIGLQSLNLSRNNLSGSIIDAIGQLRYLDSLDLSINHLSGEIPQSLSDLGFLGSLNLSYNDFSGRIPLGGNLDTFHPSAYMGNPRLCGFPLSTKCAGDENTTYSQMVEHNETTWLYFGMVPGFIISFCIVWGVLACKKAWRISYHRFIDDMCDQIYVTTILNYRRMKRRILKKDRDN